MNNFFPANQTEVEHALSSLNAKIAKTTEILQASIALAEDSRALLYELQNEVEGIYLSLENT